MSMTKLQVGVTAALVVGLAITATIQHQGRRQLREENEALRRQIAALAADNRALSNRLQQPAPAAASEQGNELLRLRGEVARLRQEANAAAKLREENLRLQAAAVAKSTGNADEELLRFEGMAARMVNTGKRIGLAMRLWAGDHADVFPTDLLSVTSHLGDVSKDLLDGFELVNMGKANPNTPLAILARERVPRRNPQGGWERAYILCDGFVEQINSPDGNFDGCERPNTNQVLELGLSGTNMRAIR